MLHLRRTESTFFPCIVNIGPFFCEVLDIQHGDHMSYMMAIVPNFAVNTILYTSEHRSYFYVHLLFCKCHIPP